MSASRVRSYNIHLKFKPESFAQIQAVRNAATRRINTTLPVGHSKPIITFPYLSIFGDLPKPLVDSYSQALAKIASQKAPFIIKTFSPQLLHRPTKFGHEDRRDVAFKLDSTPLEAIRSQIYAEFKGAFAELAQQEKTEEWEFKQNKEYTIGGYSSLPVRTAEKILQDVLRDYPEGAGDLIVESLCLKEYLVGSEKSYATTGWVAEYPLEG